MPGQVLCLGRDGEDCSTIHVVQLGDTCSDIIAANQLNSTIFSLNNPQLDAECHIYVDQVRAVYLSPLPPNRIGGLGKTPESFDSWHRYFQRLSVIDIHFSDNSFFFNRFFAFRRPYRCLLFPQAGSRAWVNQLQLRCPPMEPQPHPRRT